MAILQEYHKPTTLAEASALLRRPESRLLPLAGGTHLVGALETRRAREVDGVVDLAALGLDSIWADPEILHIGATATLSAVAEHPVAGQMAQAILQRTARYEGPINLRNAATVGGAVALAEMDGEFYTALLALDAQLILQDGEGIQSLPLANFPGVPPGWLITRIDLPRQAVRTGHARVARTPSDRPIVAAVAVVKEGEGKVALCGVGDRPLLAGVEINPPTDFKGSAAYRRAMAQIMQTRAMAEARGTER